MMLLTAVILTSCSDNNQLTLTTATDPDEYILNPTTKIYVDADSDAGFNYKYCYDSEDMSGNLGIASSDGSILLDSEYVSVYTMSQNRFVARKFVDQSAHSALVDENGKEIIPFFRGEIRIINNRNIEGAEVILSVEPFGGKDTFVDLDGKKIFSGEFNGTGFNDEAGLFYGYTDEEYYMFDNNGKLLCTVAEGETAELRSADSGYTELVKNCGNTYKFGLKNAEGKEVVPCDFDQIEIVSDNCFVGRIGEAQSIQSTDVIRIFNGNGVQLTKDGEFNAVRFEENSEYGIGYKYSGDNPEEGETHCWIINQKAEKVSGEYDGIYKTESGEFIGTLNNTNAKVVIDN